MDGPAMVATISTLAFRLLGGSGQRFTAMNSYFFSNGAGGVDIATGVKL